MAGYETRQVRPSSRREPTFRSDGTYRSSRRDDHYREEDELRSGYTRTSMSRKHDRHDSRYHDSRHHLSVTKDHDRRTSHSPVRKRKTWPPQPTAEDEKDSLRREAGSPSQHTNPNDVEVRSRGAVDQDPLLIEVPEFMNQHERRFTWQASAGKPNIPTPPSSEDETRRRFRQRTSRSEHKTNDTVPELSPRISTPYSFNLKKSFSAANERFPVDDPSPPRSVTSDHRSSTWHTGDTAPPTPSSQAPPSASKRTDLSNREAGGDSVRDAYERRQTSPAPPNLTSHVGKLRLDKKVKVDDVESSTSSQRSDDEKSRRPAKSSSPNTAAFPGSKSSSASAVLSAGALGAATMGAATLGADLLAEKSRPRERGYSSSRPKSPSPALSRETATPSRSPRHSGDLFPDPISSVPRPVSRHGSRPSSPTPRIPSEPVRMLQSDLDWTALMAANAQRRSKPPPSRLAASTIPDHTPPLSRHTSARDGEFRPQAPLPYPEESSFLNSPTITMPSERDHQYFGDATASLAPPEALDRRRRSRTPSPTFDAAHMPMLASNRFAAPSRPQSPSTKPVLPRVHSSSYSTGPTDPRPNGTRSRVDRDAKYEQTPRSPHLRPNLAARVKKDLPPCPRAVPIAGIDEWYSLKGIPKLEFCPDCTNDILESSPFRNSIQRAAPKSARVKTQCAFGSAWNRLAWIFTLYLQNPDLQLLRDMVEIDDKIDSCPGDKSVVRTWYGLQDNEGFFVRDFQVCSADVRRIERLFPSLGGLLVRIPQTRNTAESHRCAMRLGSSLFTSFIDAMITANEQAATQRLSTPSPSIDSMPLIDLIERISQPRDCPRDTMLPSLLWHFHPHIRDFTVCEQCFETIVEPAITLYQTTSSTSSSSSSSSSSTSTSTPDHFLLGFQRTLQPVRGEGLGSSCQLYSDRMRDEFKRAVLANDRRMLARVARERRENEVRLQERYRDVLDRFERLMAGSGGGGAAGAGGGAGEERVRAREMLAREEEKRRLQRELEKISEEWTRKWE